MTKIYEDSFEKREQRITDTIALDMPDRVPIMLELAYFPAKFDGITCEAAFYDYDKWLDANCKVVEEYMPDMAWVYPFFPGTVYELLDSKQMIMPGKGISPHHGHRFIEKEFMQADEFDQFLNDPTDFLLRCFLPRIMGSLNGFQELPPFSELTYSYFEAAALGEAIASPNVLQSLETLIKAGKEMIKWREKGVAFLQAIENLGVPLHGKIGVSMPFDMLSYHLRGLTGIYKDMYRQPDKLMEVLEKMLKVQIDKVLSNARKGEGKRVFLALHRGADGFMSPKHFETFYWPHVKKIVQVLVDEGYTPCLFLEGDYTSRLEYFLELPAKKVLGRFDAVDFDKAKQILGGHMCLMGNVPSTLLQFGTPQEVADYCKQLIDSVGRDGGLIVAPRSSIDEASPQNIKAMVETTKSYGRYR